jgi:hypothetical protein
MLFLPVIRQIPFFLLATELAHVLVGEPAPTRNTRQGRGAIAHSGVDGK